jgi:lipopolysaccharide export system protein LptA
MSHRTLLPLVLLALGTAAFAQKPATPVATPIPAAKGKAGDKPLTEADLLKTLDEIRVGDPIKAAPMSARDLPTLSQPASAPAVQPASPAAAKKDNQTEITANEASFDQKNHQGVFLSNVVVINPDFQLRCDKLTVFMKHDAPLAGQPAPAATPTPAGKAGATKTGRKAAPGTGKSSGGLERAIAEGNVVITQDKVDADGKNTHSVGHGRRAEYEAATGDITLTGKPDVAQGINTLEATDESTVIILNREGKMRANGPHKSTIRDTGDSDSASNPLKTKSQ